MHVVVVIANPGDDPLLSRLRDAVEQGLRGGGHTATVLDLYAERFDPVMPASQRRDYEQPGATLPADLDRHVAAVRSAEALVFLFPTWTASMPVMVKGWLDRVLVPGVAFHLDQRSNQVRSDLRRIRRLAAVTISTERGSRWRRTRKPARWTVTRTLRLLTSWRCRTMWLSLTGTRQRSSAECNLFLARVEVAMSKL